MLESLESFVELARNKSEKIVAVAAAEDSHALEAIKLIIEQRLGKAILIGCREEIVSISASISFNIENVEIIDIPDKMLACEKAVALVKQGNADILMKGLVDSSIYLRAILNKEHGICQSSLVTQIAFIQSPYYHKLFAATDAGINIAPTFSDKEKMLRQSVDIFHLLGIKKPKVAVIAAVERVTKAIPATQDADMLSQSIYADCVVEGPLSIDLAFSFESCEHKGISSKVGGDVDLILLPEINSANVFYKTMTQLGAANSASFLTGTSAPVVFTSRSDSAKTKYFAIACAIAQCKS